MIKIAGYFALLEIAGLLGFIMASHLHGESMIRYLPFLMVLLAICYVAYEKATLLSAKEIFSISFIVSVIFTLCVQVLGFMAYSGLSKDIDFLSRENAARTGIMLLLGTAGHFLLLTLAGAGRSWLARMG